MTREPQWHADSGHLGVPALVLHGGAGSFERSRGDEEALVAALQGAADAGWELLAGGGRALDAVVEAVASLEDCGEFNAGRGAVATSDGEVEMDAGVMDAATGAVGAVCAARYPANPVRAARAVADAGGVPRGPVLLAGEGADLFCAERGLEKMHREWLAGGNPRDRRSGGGPPLPARSPHGTVGAVALDTSAGLAAATSTGGRAGQVRGRVGDSPIPGAGVLARAGVGVSATGEGEAFLVAGFAHRVAWSLESGADLLSSLREALSLVTELRGTGGAIAVAGGGEFAAAFSTPAMARAWRGPEGRGAKLLP